MHPAITASNTFIISYCPETSMSGMLTNALSSTGTAIAATRRPTTQPFIVAGNKTASSFALLFAWLIAALV
jgi:hypothetical protein